MESGRARQGRPTGADGEQTRKRIVVVAMQHVAARGSRARRSRRSLPMPASAFYHYFSSKSDLVTTTFNEVLGQVLPELEAATAAGGLLP
ncbi:MAG: hypothetical protein QOD39_5604 [Mycobacterium sp.]|jgi:AcrR family transcriptional regulator|nr:hypothetical protein [Mycobacterium sp.]